MTQPTLTTDELAELARAALAEHRTPSKPLVYVSGPYSQGDVARNVRRAIDEADILLRQYPVAVVIPHLTHFHHMIHEHKWEFWIEQDLEILQRCDALYHIAGPSEGSKLEMARARELGMPVFGSGDGDTASTGTPSPGPMRLWVDDFIAHAHEREPMLAQAVERLLAENAALTDGLEDMANQFAYRVRDGEMCTGGLSALEHAFELLGWDDPRKVGGE